MIFVRDECHFCLISSKKLDGWHVCNTLCTPNNLCSGVHVTAKHTYSYTVEVTNNVNSRSYTKVSLASQPYISAYYLLYTHEGIWKRSHTVGHKTDKDK